MKRIFVGIPITKELQEAILLWQNKFLISNNKFQINSQLQNPKIRFLQGKNLHITLVPPWAEGDIGLVTERLLRFARNDREVRPFEIKFEHISFGSNPKEPRLIWASGQAPKEIYDLRDMIYESLGQKPDNRPFRLHTTLARFKPQDFKKFPIKVLNEKADWKMAVNSFALYESHLFPQGSDYDILSSFEL